MSRDIGSMVQKRRVLRKIEPATATGFDEQLWPINVALLVMLAFVGGLIATQSDFKEPRLLHNGWFHLGTLVATVGLFLLAAIKLEGPQSHRLQLAALVSLLIHLVIGLGLTVSDISTARANLPERPEPPEPEEVLTIVVESDRTVASEVPAMEHDRPVEVDEPDDQPQQIIEREEDPLPVQPDSRPTPLPEPAKKVEPNQVRRTEVEQAAPRRSNETSQLSRQATTANVTPERPVESPEAPVETQSPASASASTSGVQREAADAAIARQQLDAPALSPEVTPQSIEQSQRTAEARLDTARDAAMQSRQATSAEAPAQPAEAPGLPALADAPTASASEATIARSTPRAPLRANSAATELADAETAPDPSAATVARSGQAARPESSSSPMNAPPAPRAQQPAATAASPANIAAPAIAPDSSEALPAAQASRSVISPSTTGAAGIGQGENFDRGLPTTPNPEQVASAAARRTAASQQAPAASAAAPSAPARIARSRADAEAPGATLRAVDIPTGEVVGAVRTSEVDATASAAIQRSAAAAGNGPVTADRGMSEVDLGAPAIVADVGPGRGAGGGEPQVSSASPGGQLAPRRPSSSAAAVAAGTVADVPEAPPGGGLTSTDPAGSASVGARQLTGARQSSGTGPVAERGGAPGPEPIQTGPSGAVAARSSAAASITRSAPTLAGAAGADRIGRAGPVAANAANAGPIEAPELGAGSPSERPTVQASALTGSGQASQVSRQPGGGLPVEVDAGPGVGGLGPHVTADVGSPSRHAQRDSPLAHLNDARFVRRQTGGPLSIDGRVRDPAEAYRGRTRDRRGTSGLPGGLAAKTEEAIEHGLEFLARHQSADGSWSLHNFPNSTPQDAGTIQSNSAATGLALLTFLGAGYDHYDDKYSDVVQAGLQWLLEHQSANGDLYVPQDALSNQSAHYYSHGIATIALCEAYGMTRDEKLQAPAQRALEFIVAAQHPTLGGWRYSYQTDTDTSVTGWQVMALKSGELAGLQVPGATFSKVSGWLNAAKAPPTSPGEYVYSPYAKDGVDPKSGRKIDRWHLRNPTNTMTAAGLLMRLYLGWSRDHSELRAGADYLAKNLPVTHTRATTPEQQRKHGGRSPRDTYYWYYATQVMYHMRGDYWKAWYDRLYPILIEDQIKQGSMAGSWNPAGDAWGEQGGRIYVTTLNLLSLEVYYRHLPIHNSAAK